ncbi:MAG: hypothetical protein ACAH89_07160 [Rariglobus sp.]|nr:hypothetical protein [Rariglobus sp.]
MKATRIDMNEKCREALGLFADGDRSRDKFEPLKKSMQDAMVASDKSTEDGRMDHGALLLFLCAIDDFEKHDRTEDQQLRSKLFMAAVGKLRSAEIQYDRS